MISDLVAQAVVGLVEGVRKLVSAARRPFKSTPRERHHVPTKAERQAQRDADEHRLNRFGTE